MRVSRFGRAAVVVMAALASSAYASHIRRGPTAGRHKTVARVSGHSTTPDRPHSIDDDRASAIQTALVKAGYLSSVSGHWDAESRTAMEKLQADNGWQTQIVPDSRALIKLGLGPGEKSDPPATATATASSSTAASLPLSAAEESGAAVRSQR